MVENFSHIALRHELTLVVCCLPPCVNLHTGKRNFTQLSGQPEFVANLVGQREARWHAGL